ncbi:F-box/kelch-repeat protein At3g06240-like [Papaver somniferum]|uniref:F-box/kelch-repeat protein At3g06240-like n=1 Tax=Papaver somniferum TaxID=3469 RepID=UPI000E7036F5|nr:F-box/kelch-repeat protein At3g06240-like [Papaver somniferum]
MSRRKLKKKAAAMPNLPEEIQLEIFARLPVKSLSRFLCVSKSLSTVIASSEFTNMHLNNMKSNPSILYHSSMEKICSIDYKSISSLFPLSKSSSVHHYSKFTNQMRYPSIPVRYLFESLCSCDGWLCIRTNVQNERRICFWNPLTNEQKRIPGSDIQYDNTRVGVAYGLGYDCKIGNYKLARIVSSDIPFGQRHSKVDVYTLGSNEWKSIHQNIPYYEFTVSEANEGVHLNGAIHWLARTIGEQFRSSKVLVSFDISNEILKEVALPEESIPDRRSTYKYNQWCQLDVEVLGGCLCLISHVSRVRVDVWVMMLVIED